MLPGLRDIIRGYLRLCGGLPSSSDAELNDLILEALWFHDCWLAPALAARVAELIDTVPSKILKGAA
jgi:hypothetical protein